ncbi:hypothetical protein NVP1122B_24 [Vibrio phage 1.122.B._10N.286.46.F8]|nr:hypothetical protein NVP1122A_24 [Vibrio phage 1.122.A._10N.286.46.F8]AUR89384.1 hypothetical protein NVP1122B_24 [Vibrio phage 1.122.B._10N.286.46.F8]
MADINYPLDLPLMLEAGKTRQQPSATRSNDPLVGPPFFEAFTDDRPAIFNGQFKFHSWQARKFIAFFRVTLKNGAEWFNMNIKTESGLEEMECHFVGSVDPSSQANGVFTYDFSIIARRLPNELTVDNSDYYLEADSCQLEFAGLIDEAVNLCAPQA